jgi:purine-binding chemotaxis protein CheW
MSAFDWAAAHARLAGALEPAQPRSAEEARDVLERRARALAAPRAREEPAGELVDVVTFSLAGERYALPAAAVLEVFPLEQLTRLPRTPPFLLGVCNHRGRILPVVELESLLDVAPRPRERRHAIVVERHGNAFAIAADAVEETAPRRLDPLSPPPAGETSAVRGVTADLVTVLDPDALASDPRLEIDDA